MNVASKKRKNGPIAQIAFWSFALTSRSAERPSKSRRLTSLPSVAPTIAPLEATASAISGSGLFQNEPLWNPASSPDPTADMGWLLVKTSASGPMPTSKYCDQAPALMSASLSRIAAGEPLSFDGDVAESKEVTLAQWRQRSAADRVKEMFARLWQYWL